MTMLSQTIMLAQGGPVPGRSDAGAVMLTVGLLVGVVVIATVVLLLVRGKVTAAARDQDHAGSFMDQLRVMRDTGKISEEEFQATRARMREKLSRADEGKPLKRSPDDR